MKKQHPIKPGEHVGERSPKDDAMFHQQHQRDAIIRAGARGRTEPRRGPTPPRKRSAPPK